MNNVKKIIKKYVPSAARGAMKRGTRNVMYQIEEICKNKVIPRKEEHVRRFIHIGYPKAASTSLQFDYFSRHKQILHLGAGVRKKRDYQDDIGFIDNDISIAVEIDLRYRNRLVYDACAVKEKFQKYFDLAQEDKRYHAVGLSSENMCFQFNYGVDTYEKARRLHEIFGTDTSILLIVRDQKSLLTSLYKEMIRQGYSDTFSDFLEYTYNYKDRNWFFEFCYDKVYDLYSSFFGEANVHVVAFELLLEDRVEFLKQISASIGVDYYDLTLKNRNVQLSPKALTIKRQLNQKCPHTVGTGFYLPFQTHRHIPYFLDELGIPYPNADILDYRLRGTLCRLSTELADIMQVDDIDVDFPERYERIFGDIYKRSNVILCKKTHLELAKYGYWLDH